MFGYGRTRLQPAYVEDVAEAIAQALQRTQMHAITFECGGPCVYSYEELLRALARKADLKRILIPLPFGTAMDCRTAPESARHSQSSGADAGR
jgi:NADH dehydrogenase